MLAIDPELFPSIVGTTDSEVLFYLALTFGLEEDPLGALERMAGFVEAVGHSHDIAEPLQMTIGLSDGERLYAARYASGPVVNTLFVSEDTRVPRDARPGGGVHLLPGQVGTLLYAREQAAAAPVGRGAGDRVRADRGPARAVDRGAARRRR